jgi:hypothetical protein
LASQLSPEWEEALGVLALARWERVRWNLFFEGFGTVERKAIRVLRLENYTFLTDEIIEKENQCLCGYEASVSQRVF